jgi:glycosyltransferase involved in cell wall biosynthesis
MICVYIVVPCYNEEEVLNETAKLLEEKIKKLVLDKKISDMSRIVFVDDGSKDKTWELIKKFNSDDNFFCGIKLSRNRGHQNALLAGLMTVKNFCDESISIDADLQDDINAIDKMIEEFKNGSEIVYGVRNKRKSDSFFKRFTAEFFYKLMKFFGCEIIFNHADFRLMSKKSLDALAKFNEVNLFLRGIIPMIGYKSSMVEYERKSRTAGKSKYTLKKMIDLAMNGVTSFAIYPSKLLILFGLFVIFLVALFCFVLLVIALFDGVDFATGHFWQTIFIFSLIMYFLAVAMLGILLVSVGIIGEYIKKIYLEVKHRPRFIIEEFLK